MSHRAKEQEGAGASAVGDAELAEWVRDSRVRLLDLIADLDEGQLNVPLLEILNPFVWEIGHVAWFHERWVLRHALGRPPVDERADELYDSMAVAHDSRWELALPSLEETLAYMRRIEEEILERLESGEVGDEERYFVQLGVFHEDMHGEAFLYARQTLGYALPRLGGIEAGEVPVGGPLSGDAEIPGGTFWLGAHGDEPFLFDNERWGHPVEVAAFRMARAPVSQGEFAAFVDEDGYRRRELWDGPGRRWLEESGANGPLYWRREAAGAWSRRHFDRWVPLQPHKAMVHVNWHEARAYCRWAGRRLPSEAEWELAACSGAGLGEPGPKPRFPWRGSASLERCAALDGRSLGTVEGGSLSEGESPWGLRHLAGNVWEWTESPFAPFPGFVPDPYKDYSQPWFRTRRVLRGGAWMTRARMLRNTWRNFYPPHRRDVWAGFRTCALGEP